MNVANPYARMRATAEKPALMDDDEFLEELEKLEITPKVKPARTLRRVETADSLDEGLPLLRGQPEQPTGPFVLEPKHAAYAGGAPAAHAQHHSHSHHSHHGEGGHHRHRNEREPHAGGLVTAGEAPAAGKIAAMFLGGFSGAAMAVLVLHDRVAALMQLLQH